MALPPRYVHSAMVTFKTAIPFKSSKIESLISQAVETAVKKASVESPVRDVQEIVVEFDQSSEIK